jgi:hypothetical protein
MLRRIVFILSILIIALSAPIDFMVIGVSAQVQPPPEEYIPEGDPTPPPVLIVHNPDLVVVPSGEAQVYMVPNMVGVYFYEGRWYRYHHGVWFTAGVYNEPWVFVQPPVVPSFVVGISPAYAFYLPRGYHRIHYGEFHSHWHTWDREKHWHHERWFQNERRAEVRHARERQAHARMEKDRHQRKERVKSDKVGYKQRLADHAKNNKPTPSDKTGKIDRTGKTDKTGKTGKVDKTGSTGSTTKTDGINKTGGATTKTGGIGTTKIDKTGSTGSTTKTGGATTKTGGTGTTKIDKTGSTSNTTKTGGVTKTGGTSTKTGGTTKISNQPNQPKPQPKLQPKPQPKPQPRPQLKPKPQPKPQPKEKEKDKKHNER